MPPPDSCWRACPWFRGLWQVGLERTSITRPDRLERLFELVILAWVSCLRVDVWLHAHVPIKVKAHGRPTMSLLRDGAEQWKLPE